MLEIKPEYDKEFYRLMIWILTGTLEAKIKSFRLKNYKLVIHKATTGK